MLTMLSVAQWSIITVWARANPVSRGTRTVHRSSARSVHRCVVREAATWPVEMCRIRGRVAIRSTVDPQSATIRFDRGSVHVTRGVAGDADIVVAADVNAMGRPGSRKPQVSGAIRHPRLALGCRGC